MLLRESRSQFSASVPSAPAVVKSTTEWSRMSESGVHDVRLEDPVNNSPGLMAAFPPRSAILCSLVAVEFGRVANDVAEVAKSRERSRLRKPPGLAGGCLLIKSPRCAAYRPPLRVKGYNLLQARMPFGWRGGG